MSWHVGCSGYHYKEWKERFYPAGLAQKKWFEYYATVFDSLELNVSFYRFPQLSFLQNWYTISPAHFKFSVKAPRLISHYKQFIDCERLLSDFYSTTRDGLKDKLGAILFQFPATFDYRPERFDRIVNSVWKDQPNVFEFRHASWWQEEVLLQLRDSGLSISGISHPALPDHPLITGATTYYRFHGVPKLYYSPYRIAFLKNIADDLLTHSGSNDVYVFFNNTATMAAIRNAAWLKKYLASIKKQVA